MAERLDVTKFLEDVTGRYAEAYEEAVSDLLIATLTGNAPAMRAASKRLQDVTAETMGMGEVLGASITLQGIARLIPEAQNLTRIPADLMVFADEMVQNVIPRVTLSEALEDMVTRTPVTIRDAAQRTAQNISKLYGEGRVIAFAKAAEDTVTQRAQQIISQGIRDGIPEVDVGKQLVKGVDEARKLGKAWTPAYSRMVFRTNLNTAATAGMFRQSQDQDIKEVVPAFRFDTAGDADTRPNHAAADGLILKVDNVLWNDIAPPLGYNCRCQPVQMTLPMLRRMGRVSPQGKIIEDRGIPAGAFADPGFRHGRPDLFINSLA